MNSCCFKWIRSKKQIYHFSLFHWSFRYIWICPFHCNEVSFYFSFLFVDVINFHKLSLYSVGVSKHFFSILQERVCFSSTYIDIFWEDWLILSHHCYLSVQLNLGNLPLVLHLQTHHSRQYYFRKVILIITVGIIYIVRSIRLSATESLESSSVWDDEELLDENEGDGESAWLLFAHSGIVSSYSFSKWPRKSSIKIESINE